MAANTLIQWLVGELRVLAGFDEVEEMAEYLLTLPNDAQGLSTYLGELLGSGPATIALANALVARRSAAASSNTSDSASGASGNYAGSSSSGRGISGKPSNEAARVPKPSKSAKAAAGPLGSSFASTPGLVPTSGNMPLPAPPQRKNVSQKERARLNRQQGSGNSAAGSGGGRGAALPHVGVSVVKKQKGEEKSKAEEAGEAEAVAAVAAAEAAAAIELDDEGFQVMPETFVETSTAEVRMGVTRDGQAVLANCLLCGFINLVPLSASLQKQARSEAATNKEAALAAADLSTSNTSAPVTMSVDASLLRGCWTTGTSSACASCGGPLERSAQGCGSAEGYARAAALRDKLVQFDADAVERQAVYDDESDYYTSAAWLSDLEREELMARDAARHSAMHDRSSRHMSLSLDLAGRQLVDASPEGSLDAARRRYAEAQQPLQQQAAQKAAGERALRTAGMENLNRIVDATSSGSSADAARRRYAEAQQPQQQQAAQQAAAERAMRMAGVDKVKANLDDGLCGAPDNADSSASGCSGASGSGGGGGASVGGGGVSGGNSVTAEAEAGDFANATLTGRSLEVASALGSLFTNRARKDPNKAAVPIGSSSNTGKGGGSNSSKKQGSASNPAGAGGESIAGLEAALAPWRPEQRRRKGVEIGGGLI